MDDVFFFESFYDAIQSRLIHPFCHNKNIPQLGKASGTLEFQKIDYRVCMKSREHTSREYANFLQLQIFCNLLFDDAGTA